MAYKMASSLFGRRAFRAVACFSGIGTGLSFSGTADAAKGQQRSHASYTQNRSYKLNNDYLLKGRKEKDQTRDPKNHPLTKMADSVGKSLKEQDLKYKEVYGAIENMKREHPDYEEGLSRESVTTLFNHMGVTDNSVIDSVFNAMDADEDGRLEYEDVMTTLVLLTEGTDSQKSKFLFKVIDADNSGLVDADEMRRFMRALLKVKFVVKAGGLDADVPEFFLGFTDEDFNSYAKYSANKLVSNIFLFADTSRRGELNFKQFKRWFSRGGPDVSIMRSALHDLVETGHTMT